MPYATVTSKGQITIPIEVRNDLELKAGDKILFAQGDNGVYLMIAKNKSVKRLKGMFGKFHRTVSIEEMNETIARAGAGLPEPEEEFAETL
jgi:antitoxin PrlF